MRLFIKRRYNPLKLNTDTIPRVMPVLERYFHYTERTTLNRLKQELCKTKTNEQAFRILIACLLSLRSRDETTEKITKELFEIADTPEKIIALPLKRLEGIIYSTGHYHKKALVLKSVSKEILERFQGKIPNNREELLSIKGIGPKTANIVLNLAFCQPVIPIDTHCHRIPNRLGWVATKTPEKTEEALSKILPKQYWFEFNGLFVLFGRTICTPLSPKCSVCPINKLCPKIGVVNRR